MKWNPLFEEACAVLRNHEIAKSLTIILVSRHLIKLVWFLGYGKYMLVVELLVVSGCHIASCELRVDMRVQITSHSEVIKVQTWYNF